MARKNENNYFKMFAEAVSYSCKAADILKEDFTDFDPARLAVRIEEMHHIEHTADIAKHELMEKLMKEFITPIDREDILELSNALDDVTDSLEDVLLQLYMFGIISLREDSLTFAAIINDCCHALKKLMLEFENFRKSKVIKDMIIEINHLEKMGTVCTRRPCTGFIQKHRILLRCFPGLPFITVWRNAVINVKTRRTSWRLLS